MANISRVRTAVRRRTHRKLWKLLPAVRVIGVLSAVGIATTLVTFAAIQSNGSALTGNTIQTATASLQISTDGSDYRDSVPGFDFTGLVPGGSPQPTATANTVYIHNNGTANLNLSLTVPAQPTVNGTVEFSKVLVWLISPNPTIPIQKIPLSDLRAGQVSIASSLVAAGATASYKIEVQLLADAVTGNGATITGLDLSFSGTPQVP